MTKPRRTLTPITFHVYGDTRKKLMGLILKKHKIEAYAFGSFIQAEMPAASVLPIWNEFLTEIEAIDVHLAGINAVYARHGHRPQKTKECTFKYD